MPSTPRLTQPRKWRSFAFAGAAVTLAAPALAGLSAPISLAPINLAPINLAPINLAPINLSRAPDARLWLAQSQGGEGGESGLVASAASPDAAYLAELMIVEGHMVAALDLYAKGQTDFAVELAGHPESEGMMDTLRKDLAARSAPDVTPSTTAFTKALTGKVPLVDARTALAAVHAALVAAAYGQKTDLKTRLNAVVVLLKAASDEYSGAIDAGKVADVMAYHEAYSFIALARIETTLLIAEPLTAKAASRALDAMQAADDAFSDMTKTTVEARDPTILAAIAARVELIASSVR